MQFKYDVAIGHGYRNCLITLAEDDGYFYVGKVEYKGDHKHWRDITHWVEARELADIARKCESDAIHEYNYQWGMDLGQERAIFSI